MFKTSSEKRVKSRLNSKRKRLENPSVGTSKNYEALRISVRKYRKKLREGLLVAYGGECVCCGEKNMKFLCFDHINNDGNKQRREIGDGVQMHSYMKKNMPKDIQILCYNCNNAKKVYGKCPHSE